jgi:hypothetical protein
MPNWKKVITSGSDANLNNLFVTNDITSSVVSASTYYGDGSNLTGISAGGGIFAATGSFQSTTNDLQITGSVQVYKSGSTVFNIEGSQGNLFAVTDELSGSLFSVNDISGIPIFEVFSDNTVKIGTYNAEELVITDSMVILSQVSESLNFADDSAADEGGVPLGGLYHNDGSVRIRLT